MKVLLLTLFLGVANALIELTEEQKEMLKPYKNACLAELKLGEEFLEKAKQEIQTTGTIDLNDQMSCFSACIFKKIGFMTEEGEFDEEMVRALAADQFPEDILNPALDACRNEAGTNDCETAGKLVACLLKQGISVNS